MDYTTLTLSTREGTDPETIPVTSLYEVLQGLPDRRRAQGKRYSLAFILSCVI